MRKRVVSLRKRKQLSGTLHLSLGRRRPSPNLNSHVRHRSSRPPSLAELKETLKQVDAAFMAMPAHARMAFVVHRVRGSMTAWTEIERAKDGRTEDVFRGLVSAVSGAAGSASSASIEANRWISQVRVHDLSIEQRCALLEWVAVSPENGRALVRAEVIWQAAADGCRT